MNLFHRASLVAISRAGALAVIWIISPSSNRLGHSADQTVQPSKWTQESLNQTVNRGVSSVEASTGPQRASNILALSQELEGVQRARGQAPSASERTQISSVILKAVATTSQSDPSYQMIRLSAIELLSKFGDGGKAKQFVFDALERGTPDERVRVLMGFGYDGGSIPRQERWTKVEEAFAKGHIDQKRRLKTLMLLDEKRAYPIQVQALFDTKDKKEFARVAANFQAQDNPSAVRELLAAAAKHGFLNPQPNGLYSLGWIDPEALGRYLAVASDEDLPLALDIANKSRCISFRCLGPIRARGLLAHPRSDVRTKTLNYINDRVQTGNISPEVAEGLISSRLAGESDPQVRKTIDGVVASIADAKRAKGENRK